MDYEEIWKIIERFYEEPIKERRKNIISKSVEELRNISRGVNNTV